MGAPNFLLHVTRHDALRIAADLHPLPAERGAVHGVVGHQRQQRAIGLLQPDEPDLAISGTIGI